MSAPHVTGATALVKQAHPEWSPEEIKAAIMNTAKPIEDLQGKYIRHMNKGARSHSSRKGYFAETLVFPGTVGFGKWTREEARQTKEIELTIKNVSNRTTTYHVNHHLMFLMVFQWKVPFSITLKPNEAKKVPISIDILPAVFQAVDSLWRVPR
ncbi:S8 family serine peptidase [Anaerobacillus sp. HL2]|nr:S8 family serine peptidase [Anaerobacillus sp. HL2]